MADEEAEEKAAAAKKKEVSGKGIKKEEGDFSREPKRVGDLASQAKEIVKASRKDMKLKEEGDLEETGLEGNKKKKEKELKVKAKKGKEETDEKIKT